MTGDLAASRSTSRSANLHTNGSGPQRNLHTHSLIYCSVMVVLWLIYVITGLRESVWFPWPLIAMGGWGVVVALHARQVYVRRVAGEEDVRRGTVRDKTPPV